MNVALYCPQLSAFDCYALGACWKREEEFTKGMKLKEEKVPVFGAQPQTVSSLVIILLVSIVCQ